MCVCMCIATSWSQQAPGVSTRVWRWIAPPLPVSCIRPVIRYLLPLIIQKLRFKSNFGKGKIVLEWCQEYVILQTDGFSGSPCIVVYKRKINSKYFTSHRQFANSRFRVSHSYVHTTRERRRQKMCFSTGRRCPKSRAHEYVHACASWYRMLPDPKSGITVRRSLSFTSMSKPVALWRYIHAQEKSV